MKIVSVAEMREIDRVTNENFGIPTLELMENAGDAVTQFVLSRYPLAKTIGVICGKGNNGGDGFVAARKLHLQGKEVRLLLLAAPSELRGDAAEMFRKLPVSAEVVRSGQDLQRDASRKIFESEILLDAILGTGFRPPVSDLYADAIAALNASSATVIAVDIPSGADADAKEAQPKISARADAVVTFTAPRPAHIFSSLTSCVATGPIIVAPIGSPDKAIISALQLNVATPVEMAPMVAFRPPDSNKGSYGHVLVIGGALGKAGSVAMSGIAALRVGAGLATVATPGSSLATVAGFHPEVMTEPLPETEAGTISLRALAGKSFDALLERKSVIAIGPGISRYEETSEFVRAVVKKYAAPMVVDADGLNAFEGCASELNGNGRWLVITPHPGEMARLLGCTVAEVESDRLNVVREFSLAHGIIVVLKGHRTLIADPSGTVWVNTTGNPGMATGGTGDILTGMIPGLMAQHPDHILDAVIAAVHLHGLAGDIARERVGEHSLVATDLVPALPEAFHRVREAAKEQFVKVSGQ